VSSMVVRILCDFQWKDLILHLILCCFCSLIFSLDFGEHGFSGACCRLRFLFAPLVLVGV
jgi:hypothetical protein